MKFTKILLLIATMLLLNSSLYAKSIVKINNTEITEEEFQKVLNTATKGQFDKIPEHQKDIVYKQILEQYINKKLIVLDAQDKKIQTTPEFIKIQQEQMKSIEENILTELYFKNLFDSTIINDDQVKNYYKTNQAEFMTKPTYTASHILLKDEKEAQSIIDSLKNKSFDDIKKEISIIANEKSIDKTKDGFLGSFELTKMIPEFSNAIKNMKVKELSTKPVKTQFGFHIILLENFKDEVLTDFTLVKDKILERLKMEQVQKEMEKQLKDLYIKHKVMYFNEPK